MLILFHDLKWFVYKEFLLQGHVQLKHLFHVFVSLVEKGHENRIFLGSSCNLEHYNKVP